MADPREFVLIGSFTDHITPALEKINSSITKLKASLGELSNATRPLKNDFKDLASLSKDFNNSIKGQSADIRQMTSALKSFRGELGRVNRAYRAGGNRVMRQAGAGATPPPPPAPSYPVRPTRTRDYGYPGAVGGAVGGAVLGSQVSDAITGSIVKGFQIGVSIMERPFQYFASALGERIKDEMSDIKAAGGYYSIAKRQDQPFVKTFDQALEFTQKNNAVLAKLAASLPGSTQDYIEVSKRIGDSVARTVMTDKGAAVAYANELRRQFPTMYGGALQGTGTAAQQGAITTLLGELTKKTVLAGQGGRSGAGGAIGPYGLPGLTERMLSQDEVSMGQFQRYSAIFSDPMIMDALNREIPKINATAKNSIERFKALQKFYDDVLPPEMIEKYRRSIAGLQEAFNTAILGPETGLFGIGRKMQGLGKKMNDFGQYVDNLGNVVSDINMAATIDLSLFDMLRDILANTAQVLMPIIENITMLWDPLKTIGLSMVDARHITGQFLKSFNQYRDGIEQYAKMLGKGMGAKLLETKDLRASFAAIANLFKQLGVFDTATFKDVSKQILDPNANLSQILKGLMDKFLNSDVALKIGEFIGTLVGTVLSEVAKAMGFVTGLATGGPLAKGLMQGFSAAGGPAAFTSIIQNTFALLGKLLLDVVKAAPLQTAVLGALMLLPAAISGLITAAITSCTSKLQGMGGCPLPGAGGRGGRAGAAGAAGYGGGGFLQTRRAAAAQRLARMKAAKMAAPYAQGAQMLGAVGKDAMRSRLPRGLGKAARMIPGGALAGGAIDMGIALASGENFGKAAVGAFGTVLGGAAGSIFGPAGTVIGSIAGGALADASYGAIMKAFEKPSMEQVKAAGVQMQAAAAQKQAADMQEAGVAGTNLFGSLKDLSQRLEVLGIKGKGAEAVKTEYAYREELTKRAKADAAALKDAVDRMVEAGTDPKKIAEFTKDLKANADKSAKELEASNKRLQQALNKLPDTVEQGLYRSLSTMPTAGIAAIFAQKIGEIKFPQFAIAPGALTIPAPAQPQAPVNIPNFNQNLWQQKPGATAPNQIFKGWNANGALGDAVASEIKHKPAGSDLVVANSSETVIPAAGGNGMSGLMETFRAGWQAIVTTMQQTSQQSQTHLTSQVTTLGVTFKMAEEKQRAEIAKISQTLVANQQQTNAKLTALSAKMNTPSMPGGLGGAGAGGVDAFTPIAARMGLQLTSGYRPGDPGWHGANRARDFSNGTGPTPQMMQFAQYMASTYGSNLKELIYTPLGFSIKNGQQVAPYAQGAHYNHVHVAYGLGAGNPAFFGSQSAAERWERSMVSGSVKIGSVTGNSAEGFGSGSVGDIYVTVNAGSTSDPDQLAYLVAERIQAAVGDAVNANILV
jgi:hypothetical protein